MRRPAVLLVLTLAGGASMPSDRNRRRVAVSLGAPTWMEKVTDDQYASGTLK